MGGLLDAITEGDVDAAGAALDASPESMNEEDPETWLSPLHHCATAGAVEIIRLLLKLGADPNAEARGRYEYCKCSPRHTMPFSSRSDASHRACR